MKIDPTGIKTRPQSRCERVFLAAVVHGGDKANTGGGKSCNTLLLRVTAKLRGSPPFLQRGVLGEKLGVFPSEDVVRHLRSVRPVDESIA